MTSRVNGKKKAKRKNSVLKKKKKTVQRNRKQRDWKKIFSAIDAVWGWWSCIYHEFKFTFEEK